MKKYQNNKSLIHLTYLFGLFSCGNSGSLINESEKEGGEEDNKFI